MPFNPKVSIVIPVYNGSNYLKEAIDSALAQTYKNIEVIVINDGSSDDGKTEAIAISYGKRIHYFGKENGGVATALNLGIQKAEGEYLSWLSHDDIYLPDKIERQVLYLGNTVNRKLILFSDFEALDMRNDSTHICRVVCEDTGKLCNALLLLFRSVLHGCTMLIPRDAFEKVSLFNEKLRTTQDYELWFKFVKQGYKFVHIPEVLIKTRWHEGQGTILMSDIHRKEVEYLYGWAVDMFSDEFNSFSSGQIGMFLAVLRNNSLKKTAKRILISWRAGKPMRFLLSFVISVNSWRRRISGRR